MVGHEDLIEAVGRTTPGGSHSFVRSVLGRYCAEGHFEPTVGELRDAYVAVTGQPLRFENSDISQSNVALHRVVGD